jgi:hypothetical protein
MLVCRLIWIAALVGEPTTPVTQWVDGRNPERQKHPTFPATEREMCTLALARRALSGPQGNEIGSVAPITYEFFYLGRQA